MKAQVLHKIQPIEARPLRYETVPDPILGPDDVLIGIKACGVCRSNLHMIEGEFQKIGLPAKLPIIPGHELTGVIENVGKNVKTWQGGERVGVQVLVGTCRRCEYCLTGRENLCRSRVTIGEIVDGGYAELLVAPWDFVYSLPDSLGFEEAAPLFCPGVTAYRAVKRAEIRPDHKVAVIGIGGVGHMSLQFAKLAGAEITAVDKFKEPLELALELGADNAVLAREFDEMADKFDVVMVHAPSQKAVDQAVKAIKWGGTVLMGVFGGIHVNFTKEPTIKGSVIGSRMDMRKTLEIASKGKVKTRWQAFRLAEANDVLLKLKKGRIVGRAILKP